MGVPSSPKRRIVVIAVILILVGGAWFLWFRKSSPPWPAELDRVLVRLEQAETERLKEARAETLATIRTRGGKDPKTANQHIFLGIMHAGNQDYRPALLAYRAATDLDKNLADPHWGKAVAIYAVAVLDMKARGLCKVTKVDWPAISERASKDTYLRREGDILSKGFFNFHSVAAVMKNQAWTDEEAMGTMGLVISRTPSLPPDLNLPERFRSAFPSSLFPLAEFTPDEEALGLLKLAELEFRKGEAARRHLGNFVPAEMHSVDKRVQELLTKKAPPPTEEDLRYLAEVRQRFARWRNTGYLLHPNYKDLTKLHDQAEQRKHPGLYSETAIAILTLGNNYTLAEELFRKSLGVLPGTDGPCWGLALVYHSLAVFDLVDRGLYEVESQVLSDTLRASLAQLPYRQTSLVVVQMAEDVQYSKALGARGFDPPACLALLHLMIGMEPKGRVRTVPILKLKVDDKARALFRVALYHAEQGRVGTPLPIPEKGRLFRPEDLEGLYPYLVEQAGRK